MRKLLLTILLTPTICLSADFSTPEAAIKSLEEAYSSKDIDKIMEARDFKSEAKLMLLKMNPELANDQEILKGMEEVLFLGNKQEIEAEVPDFSNLKCSLEDKKDLGNGVIQFNEICVFPDKGTSEQLVHAYKGERGWRFINYLTNMP
jgi:hypothetical protein